jgi:hypothetical protein
MKVQLESIPLRYVEYDADRKILEVHFRSGSEYTYSGVPELVYEGLLGAESKGRYFIENIKDHYRYWRGNGQVEGQ